MSDEIYVYTVPLPPRVHEFVAPCGDGYTIYIDEKLTEDDRFRAYEHAMRHIERADFDQGRSADQIEAESHDLTDNSGGAP